MRGRSQPLWIGLCRSPPRRPPLWRLRSRLLGGRRLHGGPLRSAADRLPPDALPGHALLRPSRRSVPAGLCLRRAVCPARRVRLVNPRLPLCGWPSVVCWRLHSRVGPELRRGLPGLPGARERDALLRGGALRVLMPGWRPSLWGRLSLEHLGRVLWGRLRALSAGSQWHGSLQRVAVHRRLPQRLRVVRWGVLGLSLAGSRSHGVLGCDLRGGPV